MTIFTSPVTTAIKGLRVELRLDGMVITPRDGYLGKFQRGKVEIILEVEAEKDFSVFTLDNHIQPVDKAPAIRLPKGFVRQMNIVLPAAKSHLEQTLESSVFVKKIDIKPYNGYPGSGRFPINMIGIRINGEVYSLGIFCQFSRVFFAIVQRESIIATEDTAIGTVLSYNPLSGVASVHYGDKNFAHRVFWKNMPATEKLYYCRVLPMGAVVTWDESDLTYLSHKGTTFVAEIDKITSVKL